LACKPGSVPAAFAAAMAIHLGRLSPGASSNQPGRRCGNAFRSAEMTTLPCRPYSVLLPAGFTMPRLLPAARCALTAPFHPCSPFWAYRALRYLRPSGPPCAALGSGKRFAFCGTFPGVAPAGRYPAPCFRGARTFLHSKARFNRERPQRAPQAAAIRPTGLPCKGASFHSVKGPSGGERACERLRLAAERGATTTFSRFEGQLKQISLNRANPSSTGQSF
jgi:hypothetical protein